MNGVNRELELNRRRRPSHHGHRLPGGREMFALRQHLIRSDGHIGDFERAVFAGRRGAARTDDDHFGAVERRTGAFKQDFAGNCASGGLCKHEIGWGHNQEKGHHRQNMDTRIHELVPSIPKPRPRRGRTHQGAGLTNIKRATGQSAEGGARAPCGRVTAARVRGSVRCGGSTCRTSRTTTACIGRLADRIVRSR